jgi:hypothetical protein
MFLLQFNPEFKRVLFMMLPTFEGTLFPSASQVTDMANWTLV